MSKDDKRQESFSIEDIIAEVKAEQKGYIPEEYAPVEIENVIEDNEAGQELEPLVEEPEIIADEETSSWKAPQKKRREGIFARRLREETEREDTPEDDDEPHEETRYGEPELESVTKEEAAGRKIILFKNRRKKQNEEPDEIEEMYDTGNLPEYPVGDIDEEEYYIEEEEYEEEEEEPEILYDFLNIPFDDPSKAIKRLGKKVVSMSLSLLLMVPLIFISAYFTFGETIGLPMPEVISATMDGRLPFVFLAGCTGLAFLLAWEVMRAGVWRLLKLKPTLDSLTAVSVITSLAHGVMLALGLSEGLPLSFVSVLVCFAAVMAKRSRAISLRRTYKCVEITSDPTAIKIVGDRKSRTAIKTNSRAFADASTICTRDMTEKTSSVFAPIAIVASFALAAVASFGNGDGGRFVWALAVICSSLSPFALCMSSVLPTGIVTKRLFSSGAAILNYKSCKNIAGAARVAMLDHDIFPLGSVQIAGMKITSNTITMEQVVADAAAVMQHIGGGVGKAFGDFAREQYLAPRKAINVRYFEGGGVAAQVRDDYVLIGSSDFLTKMGVRVHEASERKDAVFVAVNSYMSAIFTLKYAVQPQPYAAFGIFDKMNIKVDMAVKDFAVTEALVAKRFSVKKSLVTIPSIALKEAYWDDSLGDETLPSAVLTRDSALALAEVMGGAKSIVKTVRLNLFCAYACSVISMITMYFLAATDKIYLANPLSIVFYMLVWCLPVGFASVLRTRY